MSMIESSAGDNTDRTPDSEQSALGRRREKLHVTRTAAELATRRVAELDKQLDTNSAAQRENEAALQRALDRVATLKKSIKASRRGSGKLHTARRDARRVAARAQQRAATAEAKYDRAVLAEMVRREKDDDLSRHLPGAGEEVATDADAQRNDDTGTSRDTRPATRRTRSGPSRARSTPTRTRRSNTNETKGNDTNGESEKPDEAKADESQPSMETATP
jgi:hypothetical protein